MQGVRRLTHEDLMRVFQVSEQDLEANRAGTSTRRQRVRLLVHEGSPIVAVIVGCLVVGLLTCAGSLFFLFNPRQGIQRFNPRLDETFWLPMVAILAFLAAVAFAFYARDVIADVTRSRIVARSVTMEVTPAETRIRMAGTAGFVSVEVSRAAHRRLLALNPGTFDCILYRTERGQRVVAAEIA